jgi:hypothetical protein
LRPSLTFNKSLHHRPRYDLDDQKIRQLREFSLSLDPERTFAMAALGRFLPLATGRFGSEAAHGERLLLALAV